MLAFSPPSSWALASASSTGSHQQSPTSLKTHLGIVISWTGAQPQMSQRVTWGGSCMSAIPPLHAAQPWGLVARWLCATFQSFMRFLCCCAVLSLNLRLVDKSSWQVKHSNIVWVLRVSAGVWISSAHRESRIKYCLRWWTGLSVTMLRLTSMLRLGC